MADSNASAIVNPAYYSKFIVTVSLNNGTNATVEFTGQEIATGNASKTSGGTTVTTVYSHSYFAPQVEFQVTSTASQYYSVSTVIGIR